MAILAIEDLKIHFVGEGFGPLGKGTPAHVQVGSGRIADRLGHAGQSASSLGVRPYFRQSGKVRPQRFRPRKQSGDAERLG